MKGFDPFGSIPVPPKAGTNFQESHSVSGNFPLSKLCPVFCTETIPGDRWRLNVHNLTKLETLFAPAMQEVDASILWFKTPKRLLYKHFKDWYSGGTDGNFTGQKPHIYLRHFLWEIYMDDFLYDPDGFDQLLATILGPGSLWQYLGLPVPLKYNNVTGVWEMKSCAEMFDWDGGSPDEDQPIEPDKPDSDFIDLMPIMNYWMIYDQYFRDQTLCDPMFEDAESLNFKLFGSSYKIPYGTNTYTVSPSGADLAEGGEIEFNDVLPLLVLYRRAWRKDYFTSALPTPQRGPEVTIPLTGTVSAPVLQDEDVRLYSGHVDDSDNVMSVQTVTSNSSVVSADVTGGDQLPLDLKIRAKSDSSKTGLSADLSGLSPITIVAFRNLFKLQAFLEKNNIGGGRFIETILAHWAERVPDFTVQRAQYIRATSLPVQISEVLATANSSGVNGIVGDQAGRARVQGNLGKVRIYTQEPSIILGMYCVTSPGTYASQGIPRMYQRITRFDEPWRDFQHIGEQAIKKRELVYAFSNSDIAKNEEDFGYQQRFSEFKYMPNRIVGDFVTSLSFWHMARMFNAVPELNEDFVMQHLDERIFAVQNARPVIADFFFEATAWRKLSKFSTPKLT